MQCCRCGGLGATVPDPCCGAPDCEHVTDYSHYECLPPARQREEDRWAREDAEFEVDFDFFQCLT